MGLCKCPKRKVTNQFCFEHRVNVCEFCLTSGHPTCIVKSYLHWLQDSDYNPICTICSEELSKSECIRLTCYDVLHWDCLNREALKLAGDSQSSDVKCPICKANIIPSEKLVSPVADAVRKKLATVAWGRKRLGLPVMPSVSPSTQQAVEEIKPQPARDIPVAANDEYRKTEIIDNKPATNHTVTLSDKPLEPISHVHEVAPVSKNTYVREKYQNEKYQNEASRRVPDTRKEEKLNIPFDHDDDKYRRKGLRHWLLRLFRLQSNVRYAPDDPNITFKRASIIILLVVLFFMTMIVILTRVGRTFADSERSLDPRFNPHIRVADGRT